jgi:hypothetical protein
MLENPDQVCFSEKQGGHGLWPDSGTNQLNTPAAAAANIAISTNKDRLVPNGMKKFSESLRNRIYFGCRLRVGSIAKSKDW